MADDKGKTYRDRLSSAADRGMEIYDRNKRYKPNREADEHTLGRLMENVPGWRPSADPTERYRPFQIGHRPDGTPMTNAERNAFWNYADNSDDFMDTISSPKTRLEGFEDYERDLDIIHGSGNQTYHTDRKAWDEAAERLRKVNYPIMELNASDKQALQDLKNEVARNMTAPGVQKDRPGRIQEVVEAMDLTNPESGSRALLREFGRRAIDDKLTRIKAGFKMQTGEEFIIEKLKERGVTDTPQARGVVLQSLGMNKLPDKMPLLDASGNRVPLYLDEMGEGEEKDYMRRRRDPMTDTPERD